MILNRLYEMAIRKQLLAEPAFELQPIPYVVQLDEGGVFLGFSENRGEIVTSKLDENVLLLLKNATGGRYVRLVEPSDFSMTRMISRMEVKEVIGQYEYFPWLLMAALAAFLVVVIVPNDPDQDSRFFKRGRDGEGRKRNGGRDLRGGQGYED